MVRRRPSADSAGVPNDRSDRGYVWALPARPVRRHSRAVHPCETFYVAESDATARAIVEPALHYFFTVFNRGFNEAINQAAADQQTLLAQLTAAGHHDFREGNRARIDFSQLSWDDLRPAYLIAGT